MLNQADYIKVEEGKGCLIDNNGDILFELEDRVDRLFYPRYGMCQVEKDGKYGYVNTRGKLVIPFQYTKASPFSENGLAFVVGENGLGGYIDKTGKYVISPKFDTGTIFKFGLAAVSRKGKFEYIYDNGLKAINNTFKYAGEFSDCGLAKIVTRDGAHSLMDTKSREVLRLHLGNELEEFREGTRITKFRTNDGREALINAAGEIFTGFFEKIIISKYSNLHPFLRRGLWGFVDDTGDEVIPCIYKEVSHFHENNSGGNYLNKVAKVKAYHPLAENEEWGFYINQEDEIMDVQDLEHMGDVFGKRFKYVDPFRDSVALAVKR